MMKITQGRLATVGAVLVCAAGCAGGAGAPVSVSGRLSAATFPSPVTAVRASDALGVLDEVVPDGDGAFVLTLPAAENVRLELIAAGETIGIVFPRASGAIGFGFGVGARGSALDLGEVRYVGDPDAPRWIFDGSCSPALDSGGASVCVDDALDAAATCDAGCHFDHGGAGMHEGHWGRPGAGDDAADAPAAGLEIARPVEGMSYELPALAAVAAHNLPAFVGCAGDEVGEEHGF